jgi:hypothetical protein
MTFKRRIKIDVEFSFCLFKTRELRLRVLIFLLKMLFIKNNDYICSDKKFYGVFSLAL